MNDLNSITLLLRAVDKANNPRSQGGATEKSQKFRLTAGDKNVGKNRQVPKVGENRVDGDNSSSDSHLITRPTTRHNERDNLTSGGNVGGRCFTPQGKPHQRVGLSGWDAHGERHVRGRYRSTGACGTRRSAKPFHIQTAQKRNAVGAFDGKGNGIEETIGGIAVAKERCALGGVHHFNQLPRERGKRFQRENRNWEKTNNRFGEADDAGKILGAGAAFVFVRGAVHDASLPVPAAQDGVGGRASARCTPCRPGRPLRAARGAW